MTNSDISWGNNNQVNARIKLLVGNLLVETCFKCWLDMPNTHGSALHQPRHWGGTVPDISGGWNLQFILHGNDDLQL